MGPRGASTPGSINLEDNTWDLEIRAAADQDDASAVFLRDHGTYTVGEESDGVLELHFTSLEFTYTFDVFVDAEELSVVYDFTTEPGGQISLGFTQ